LLRNPLKQKGKNHPKRAARGLRKRSFSGNENEIGAGLNDRIGNKKGDEKNVG